MIALLLTTLLAFALGCAVIPPATNALLAYKLRDINHTWNESLRIYENHVRFTRRKPRFDAEKVERSMAIWAQRQVRLVNAKKLSHEQVLALRMVGIIEAPPGGSDPIYELPHEPEVRAKYSLPCSTPLRLGCGVTLGVTAAVLAASSANPVTVASGLAAAAIMACIFLCDMRVRLIPREMCALFAVVAVVFSLSVGGLEGLVRSCATALGMYLVLTLVNKVMSGLSCSPAIGDGDMRIIPLLCVFSGLTGTMYGFAGASVVMALVAAATVLFKGGNRKSYVPYAPGLSCWAAIGLLTQVACV